MNSKLKRWTSLATATVALIAVAGTSAGTAVIAAAATPPPVVIPAGSSALVGVNVTSNVYSAPNAYIVGQITAGQTWFVVGQDTTGRWTEIQIDPTNFGWVPTSVLSVGDLQLPVVAGVTGGPLTSTTPVPAASNNAPVVIAAGSSVLVGVNMTTNVYDMPRGNVVGQISAGQTWFVVGRDTTGKWTQILIDPVTFGWVVSSALGIGNIQLPVVAGVTGS